METRQEEINKLLLNSGFRNWALNSNTRDFEEWEQYLKDDSELSQLAAEAKKVVIQIELLENNQIKRDIESFEKLKKRRKIVNRKISINNDPGTKSYRISLNSIIKIAAVLSFIIVFSGLLYFNTNNSAPPIQQISKVVSKQTQNGQRLTITLPDGSKVKLNSNSSISFPKKFFNNRQVKLDGEAFFVVVRDESNPFVVKTENFQTEVLGTSFNISAYKNLYSKVSVVEGRVKVRSLFDGNDQHYEILEKEEAVKIDDKTIKKSDFKIDELLWKDGILVFSDENIQTISAKIQRWFNVTVIVKNETYIAGDFSGKYSNESLEEILTGMGYALNFSFKMEGNEILINGKK